MTTDQQRRSRSNRATLSAIIAMRLELDEVWCTWESFSFLAGEIRNKKNFESAFRSLVQSGCRWDALLACIMGFVTYNRDEVHSSAGAEDDNELGGKDRPIAEVAGASSVFRNSALRPKSKPMHALRIDPPNSSERARICANFDATAAALKKYNTLLYELAMHTPFETNSLVEEMSPVDAHLLLPRLLVWAKKLLTNHNVGNARMIESVGQLIPCIYVEWIASKQRTPGTRVLPSLKSVAELLNECRTEPVCSGDQLSESLRRFKREFPELHRRLRVKLASLDEEPQPEVDNWQRIYLRDIHGVKSENPRRRDTKV